MTLQNPLRWRRRRSFALSADMHRFLDAWQAYVRANPTPGGNGNAPLSSFADAALRMTDAFRIWQATGQTPEEVQR